jgi:hypothetical protein
MLCSPKKFYPEIYPAPKLLQSAENPALFGFFVKKFITGKSKIFGYRIVGNGDLLISVPKREALKSCPLLVG